MATLVERPDLDEMERMNRLILDLFMGEGDASSARATMDVLWLIEHVRRVEEALRRRTSGEPKHHDLCEAALGGEDAPLVCDCNLQNRITLWNKDRALLDRPFTASAGKAGE